MTRSKVKEENNPDGKRERKRKPKKSGGKRVEDSRVDIEIGDVSGFSGKFQVAGRDIITTSTPAEIDREYELSETAKLKESLLKKRSSIDALRKTQPDLTPFHVKSLKINEGNYLVGRIEFVNLLLQKLESHQTVILSGASGIGKTSVLQAGLIPRLLMDGYFPIQIEVTNRPLSDIIKLDLSDIIKLEMMSGVESTKYLWSLSLTKFLEEATECLETDEKLLLVLDGFEQFSEWSPAAVEKFRSQWDQSKDTLQLKWLFSIDRGFSASIASFQDSEEVELPPLDRISATQAIRSIEKQPGEMGEQNLKEILDGLEGHRESLNGAKINPSELQVVLEALTAGKSDKSLAKIYEDAKGLNGIFETFLVNVVNTKFNPHKRRIVREILAILEDRYHTAVPVDWIESRIKGAGSKEVAVPNLLAELKNYHVLMVRDHAYELASVLMKRAVLGWLHQQTILDQAEQESKKQLDRIRTSALRGLFGGAFGLIVFRWIVGTPVKDPASVIFYSLLYAAMGGTIGLLFTLMIDIFIARNEESRSWQRYLLSGATGLIMFATVLVVYVYLGEAVEENSLLQLFRAALVGGGWGTVTGLGIAWALGFARIPLWSAIMTAFLSSASLYLFNELFSVLKKGTPLAIILGGFFFSFMIVSVVLYRKYTEPA